MAVGAFVDGGLQCIGRGMISLFRSSSKTDFPFPFLYENLEY